MLVLVGATACAPSMNYAYQEKLPASVFTNAGEVPEQAGREARQLLSTARTVAFYPPDYCINVDKDEVARNKTLRANCGVLLSSLERAAEKAGYEVVSWQNLRGNQRPIDYAREAKVDVLFEINEFDFGPLDDAKLPRETDYVKYPDSGTAVPFTPPPDVSNRCAAYGAARRKTTIVAKVGTIDIKTVSVADGRNRWRYRKSLNKPRGIQYERVAFGSNKRANPGASILTVIGAIGLAVGAGLLLAEVVSTDDPMTTMNEKVDLGSVPTLMLATGAVTLGAGLVLTGLTSKSGGPELMCTESVIAPYVTPGSTPQVDEEAENATIRSEMISEFVDVIVDVRNTTPPPAPPAATDPVPPARVPTPPAPAPAPAGKP